VAAGAAADVCVTLSDFSKVESFKTCVCMYVYTYVFMYVCMYYMCTYVCMYRQSRIVAAGAAADVSVTVSDFSKVESVKTCVCVYVYTYVCTCVHVCMYVLYVYVCRYVEAV
jgi:hypothetical protein